jgi:hypothetical protein
MLFNGCGLKVEDVLIHAKGVSLKGGSKQVLV